MPTWLTISLAVLTLMSVGLLSYWTVVAVHVVKTMRRVPTLPAALRLEPPEAWPSVCVVVPAHNEERGIARVVESLKNQDYPRFHVVFALDRCTDRTAEIVKRGIGEDERFEVIEVDSCPEDWVGKVHAIFEGVARAGSARTAELLLFLDADTGAAPGCVRAAVMLLEARKLQMLSLMSTLTADEWFERIVQPPAAMELLRQYPILKANSREERRPFANGQFILVTREAYESVGGHEAVKSDVLEDVWLARRFAQKGHDTGLFFADGMLTCRMYETWETFRRGWLRIFGECASRKPGRLREAAWRLRLVGVLLPVAGVTGVLAGTTSGVWMGSMVGWGCAAVSVLGLGAFGGVMGYSYWFGRTPLRYTPLCVPGAWLASSIMLQAAANLERGRPTEWGGRLYQRDVR